VDFRHLRQHGFLTIAIIFAGALLVTMLIPNLDLRGALMVMAVLALLFGWIP